MRCYLKLHLTNAEVGMWNAFLRYSIFIIRYSLFNTNIKALSCNSRQSFFSISDWTLAAKAAGYYRTILLVFLVRERIYGALVANTALDK